ncbi:MAG: hypothetical protein RL272_572 [Candidatus Parcubacteria bacterium]|jgi:hypothetical protein
MHKMLLVVIVSIAALNAGCATTAAAGPGVVDQPPAVVSPPAAVPYGMPVPPPRPEAMMGPPQSWAWLYTPPMGCDRGPNSLAIANDTDYYVRVVLDGEDLQVRAANGMFPNLPPHTVAYVCLSHLGLHSVSGIAYTLRYGVPQEVPGNNGRFDWHDTDFGGVHSSGRREFHINADVLFFM